MTLINAYGRFDPDLHEKDSSCDPDSGTRERRAVRVARGAGTEPTHAIGEDEFEMVERRVVLPRQAPVWARAEIPVPEPALEEDPDISELYSYTLPTAAAAMCVVALCFCLMLALEGILRFVPLAGFAALAFGFMSAVSFYVRYRVRRASEEE